MKKELPTWQIILFFGVLVVAVILALVNRSVPEPKVEGVPLSKATCDASGGVWNECGSLCPKEEELCAQVCVEMCECKTDDDCPFSYACLEGVNKQMLCQRSVSP